MLSFVGTALFKLGIPGDLSQFWVAFEMETFDENRIQNDSIIQQTQNTYTLSKIPETKAKWAEMIALFQMIGLRDVCRTSQGLYNPKGQVEVELEKIRSISRLACPSDKGCFSRSWERTWARGQPISCGLPHCPVSGRLIQGCRADPRGISFCLLSSLCAFFDCIPASS